MEKRTSKSWEVYRGSKAALNTVIRSYAVRTVKDERTFLLIGPGWVQTDMGGPNALLTIDQSNPKVVRVFNSQLGTPGVHLLKYQAYPLPW